MILKRTILFALCILLLGTIPAQAAEARVISLAPTLIFDGTTALCGVLVSYYGANISLTLELWNGNVLVDSWSKSGVSTVTINEQCVVTKNNTYTLVVTGTVNNESVRGSTSRRCT